MKRTIMDPVCGLEVDRTTAEKASFHGKTYYFSSSACRSEFKKNPGKYTMGSKAKKSKK